MSTPSGYNNPAYCHQYDSSLYDYQYVPEIDPDSPDLNDLSCQQRQSKLIHPNSQSQEFSAGSDEFEVSDESNGSIIIEECNNRRVTLICEKRSQRTGGGVDFAEEINSGATYYQDVSLESENGFERQRSNETYLERDGRSVSIRHQRPLEPPGEHRTPNGYDSRDYYAVGDRRIQYQRVAVPTRYHRYEEIGGQEEEDTVISKTVHRYAEISPDENGYPALKKPIEIQKSEPKPRAITPTNFSYPISFSPPSTPSRACQRNSHGKPTGFGTSQIGPNSPSHKSHLNSPARINSFEMAELSPPRCYDASRRPGGHDQTYFMTNSPKRQPPIGASAAADLQDPFPSNPRCILPTHLQKQKRKERSHSVPNSPKRVRDQPPPYPSPAKSPFDRKVMQIFHVRPAAKSEKGKTKSLSRNGIRGPGENPVRRNIFDSFATDPASPKMSLGSPYKSTTTEIQQPKTAVITPIFQRKNSQHPVETPLAPYPGRNFQKMSHTFQSTGNIFKMGKDLIYPAATDRTVDVTPEKPSPTRLKRNQSVPNFAHTFTVENGVLTRKANDSYLRESQKQYAARKHVDNLSPIDKSRLSLIERSKGSWSDTDSDYNPRCSTCFIFATIIHLITATATCAISFYLLSKMGRRYYLDFGLLAGFVNFTLGLLGFRSYCWRWLPNRNYVSGFIGLAVFSAFTCAGLSYLIIVKPMAGDPILDVMGGAICAVSVLTILVALTGLTMSGCCKTPPPDNRVNDV